tara:strand:+ start:204 stop:803 length:600 start_codon:yes stop_codon:yes gene_type:complete
LGEIMRKYIYLIILTFFSSSVLAEGFYGGIGYLKSDVDTHKYPSLTYTAYDDEDDGFTIFGGYDFNERFGIEAGYNDLGDTTGTITAGGGLTADKEITVITLAGVLKSDPIAENIVLFVKAGLANIKNDETLSTGVNINKNTNNTFYGVGANFELPNGLMVRGLYEAYGEDDGNTDVNVDGMPDRIDPSTMSLSLIKRF